MTDIKAIDRASVVVSDSLSPYENIALEKRLVESVTGGGIVLFLWRNADTVVIGKNQNAWRECRVSEFLADGGRIARRLSGGGAVYHDAGNLNFTFAACEPGSYDLARQLATIARGCREFGIDAGVSGRNDLTAGGCKFSGNAFYSLPGEDGRLRKCHHGCVLIAADTGRMEKYLSVSKAKLQSKGVASVRSRVVNLSSLSEGLDAHKFADALIRAFENEYGSAALRLPDEFRDGEYRTLIDTLASDEWLFGRKIAFGDRFGEKFAWGEIELCFNVDAGVIKECEVFSDCMNPSIAGTLKNAFAGKPYNARALASSLDGKGISADVVTDVSGLLEKNI